MGPETDEDELLSMLERTAEAFLADRHSLARVRHPESSLWQEIVDLGLPALLLPESNGGADVGAIDTEIDGEGCTAVSSENDVRPPVAKYRGSQCVSPLERRQPARS